jgi:hypothetical protein
LDSAGFGSNGIGSVCLWSVSRVRLHLIGLGLDVFYSLSFAIFEVPPAAYQDYGLLE